jgi:hypothetical protein
MRIFATAFIVNLHIPNTLTSNLLRMDPTHWITPEIKKPPPFRGEGCLRGTTLLASLIQVIHGSAKPLWTALTGDSRHRLIIDIKLS